MCIGCNITYYTRQPTHNINLSERSILKILKKLKNKILETDFSDSKLGGPSVIVQIDETMLNHSIEVHRGRSPTTLADTLYIVEYGDIHNRCFARIISINRYQQLCR